ncbi:hypothetical protein [Planomicrobium sp. Y74]|uniref:hypothetical protein n=1 Tax=Planomicrobium sp. Y74 TaxID=2478977 RepID=UPI000EF4BC78|nr:hypothetical protein [Planomicrobium sp. Y74]RLQ91418.1 hypothetical protein D9754_06735 [Planomicrobium sp. Y74]
MGILLAIIFGVSILLSVFALFYVTIARSWQSFIVLGLATLPVSFYLLSGEMPVQAAGLISAGCFIVAGFLFLQNKQKKLV